MHDTLGYFSTDPLFRKHRQGDLTFSLLYAFSEKFILVLSHDEVVYGKRSLWNKMPGDSWRKFANLRLCLGYMFTHPGKKLLFMGSEFAQENEWNFRTELEWNEAKKEPNSQFTRFVHDINQIYGTHKALYELDFSLKGFEWIDFKDEDQSIISFIRKPSDGSGLIVVVCNMTPVPRPNYRVGVPEQGFYDEILNSDAKDYGGSGVGNLGGVTTQEQPWHGRPYSINLVLPPLGIVVFEFRKQPTS
jgi:1,4-alpha-glucan branching enzyme